MNKTKMILIIGLLMGLKPALADVTGKFEIVDLSGQIVGELQSSSDSARSSWSQACAEWKNETKDLNKNNEVLGINCNTASCNFAETGKWQCVSTGTYKVKTAGTRVTNSNIAPPLPEPPVAAPLPPEHEIAVAPPETIVEVVPPARVGFIWIGGYWGWSGHHHVWIPGRWTNARPGYNWYPERWERHGRGWHFESGRWEMRR